MGRGKDEGRKQNRTKDKKSGGSRPQMSQAQREKATTFAKYAAVVLLVAVVGPMAWIMYQTLVSRIAVLSVSNSDQLKDVFFSGNPWLVQCSNFSDIRGASGVLKDAEKHLSSHCKVGLLNCDQKLPSGKTTKQRFKLSPSGKKDAPMYFVTANGEKPQVVPSSQAATAYQLTKWVKDKVQPKVYQPTNNDQIKRHCFTKKWCGLLLSRNSSMSSTTKSNLHQLSKAYRTVRWTTLDTSRIALSAMPEDAGPLPDVNPRLLLFKQLSAAKEGEEVELAVKIHSEHFEWNALTYFLDNSLADSADSFTALPSLPTITALKKKKKAPKPAPPSRTPRRHQRKPVEERVRQPGEVRPKKDNKEEAAPATDDKPKTKEELERMRQEREQERRQQMIREQEEADNIVQEVEEEELQEEEEEEEEEVETISFDDEEE